ncbi:MAG TPA: hypothetical protein VHS96_13880 [Bacteroidia bacterium]|nr:hypothetical protein [Bacteroidia bacterium]
MHDNRDLACAIYELAGAIRCAAKAQGETNSRPVTKSDINELEENLSMKLDQIKSAVTAAAKQNREAFTEIGTKIADLNKEIQDLKDAATNPDVTDEQFLADLASLQTDAQELANIVPGSPSPETPPVTPPAQPPA